MIEARGVRTSAFRIPEHRIDSLNERATHPFTRVEYRELHALRDVCFDVHRGEFFGIVGRNGSGKSSLLKILASIYRADGGRVRMAGRVAPFIELGVGFNPELTARENVVLNGVLMGLTLREARRRLDAVLEFAELEDFVDLQLKNYSSGMLVRLAFAVMVQADADIMLIDEVLAVGDAAFAQKCMDVFHERRRAGKTIVLVTHDMATVQTLCHRAMLLHDGELPFIGEPEDAALATSARTSRAPPRARPSGTSVDVNARASARGAARATTVASAACRSQLDVVLEAARDARRARVHLPRAQRGRAGGRRLHAPARRARSPPGSASRSPGQIENRLRRRAATRSTSTSARTARTAPGRCRACGSCTSRSTGPDARAGSSRWTADIEPVVVSGCRAHACAMSRARRRSAAAGGARSSCST